MNEPLRVAARIRPHSASDLLISTAVAILQMTGLFVVPALLVWRLTHSPWAALTTGVALYLVFAAHVVRSISIGPEGIRFDRTWGSPKLIPWTKFRSASVVGRRELVWKGWLWPPFPSREMTPSYTSLGHYRFDWDEGYCYYPPRDAEQLRDAIDHYQRLAHLSPNGDRAMEHKATTDHSQSGK